MNKQELIRYLVEYHQDDEAELKKMSKAELQERYDDITDTSDWHPNETDDEFFDHEDFDD